MKELIEKYDELYEDMALSKNPARMMAFGDAEKWMFHMLAKEHPEIAEKWLTKLEAGKWNNYLSKTEAEEIASKLVNQDGSRGPHWDYETFKSAVESLGGKMKEEPFYNCYSLWIMTCALWSDHHKSLMEFVPKEQEPKVYYLMAVEKLKDVDYPKFIRKYYDL
jgi:hypothetical protein